MSRKKRVTITVDPEKLADWDEHVEESNEYRSRTGLIRKAVSNQIPDESSERTTSKQTMPGVDPEKLEEVQSTVETTESHIRRRLHEFEEKLTAIQNASETTEEFPLDPDAVLMELITDPDVEGGIRGLTASQVAERYGGDARKIKERLERLAEHNPLVTKQLEEVDHVDGTREIAVYYCEQPDAGTGAER